MKKQGKLTWMLAATMMVCGASTAPAQHVLKKASSPLTTPVRHAAPRRAAPVDALPYTNTFQTEEEQAEFTFIDANADDNTWMFVYDTSDNRYARYEGSIDKDADDWLVSPAIRLEAGKHYRVGFDTRVRYDDFDERIELKMGKEPTAEAMTQTVMEPFDVLWADFRPVEAKMVTVSETGYYHFGIHAVSQMDKDRVFADNFRVDFYDVETPAAITDLTVVPTEGVLQATVSFTAPALRINGEPLAGPLEKIELIRDGAVVNTFEQVAPGDKVTYEDNTVTNGKHTYIVKAYNEKGAAEQSEEVTVSIFGMVEMPFTVDLTTPEGIESMLVIDANNDGHTWNYEEGYRTNNEYNSDNAADDYLVSPPIHMVPGKNYNVVVNGYNTGYTERFEVKIGLKPTPEDLSKVVIEPTEIVSDDEAGEDFEGLFSVETEGNYYVAVHAISDADTYHLVLNRLTVEDGAMPTAPAAPAIEVIPDSKGERVATISVTAPSTAVDGSALEGNISRIEILRDNELTATLDNIKPGETKSVTDTPDAVGYHTYVAIAYNESGKGMKSQKASEYVGVDKPLAVENVVVTDNQNSVAITWDKVSEEGAEGHYVNPDKVSYNVWSGHLEEYWGTTYIIVDEVIGTVTDGGTAIDISCPTDEGDQGYYYWAIEPESEAGTGEMTSTGLLAGKPYDLPVEEHFNDNMLHYFADSNGSLLVSTDASDDDTSALALLSAETGEVYFNLGKLNLSATAEPVLMFDIKADGISQMNVTGSNNGAELASIQENIPLTKNYQTVSVPLSDLKEGRYAQVGMTFSFDAPTSFDFAGEIETIGDVVLIDNIRIIDKGDTAVRTAKADEEKPADVFAADGKLLRKHATTLQGLRGLTVSKGKVVVSK